MEILRALVREGVRRNVAALAAIALVLAVGLGAGLTSLEIAHRTERAYPDYLRRADVAELVVNPSLNTDTTEGIIRSVPGITSITSDALLTGSVDNGSTDPLVENFLQVRVSSDGRYVKQDRPVVDEGRMIGSGSEAFVSREAAAALGVKVGDVVPLSLYAQTYADPNAPVVDTQYALLGTEQVQIVGIGVFPDEVLADELFPRLKMLVTPDVGSKYDCDKATPKPGDTRPLAELIPELIPPNCSTSYRYYSLRVEGGDAGAIGVAQALAERFTSENGQLPPALLENNIGYEVIASFAADDAARIHQSLSPAVTSLRAFGATAVLTTVGVALLLVVRLVRRREADVYVWHALGIPRLRRAIALALPPAVAALVAVVASLVIVWIASSLGPVASARSVVPRRPHGISGALTMPVVFGVVVFAIGLLFIARRAGWRPEVRSSRAVAPRRLFTGMGGSPSLALGVRAATRSRGAGVLLVGAVGAVAAVTATLVFSASVVRFIDTPARFGWPYDAGVLINAGYGPADLEKVTASLDRPEVTSWGVAAISGGMTINGETVPFVAARVGFEKLEAGVTTVAGRMPSGDKEIALGSRTARALGLGVGDQVTVKMTFGEATARISGLIVLPTIGPLESDRTSLGTGAWLPAPLFESIAGQSQDRTGMSGAQLADRFGAFIAIDLAKGVDPAAFMAGLGDGLKAWDPSGFPPQVFTKPVRPATVIDVSAMRRVPMLLAAAFAVTMAASVVAGIASGTRARRQELGLIRALGGTPRQIRSSVRWHAITIVLVGLGAGLPIGVVTGRIAFGAFARDIGTVPSPAVPLLLLLVTAVVVVVTGLAASVIPSRNVQSAIGSEFATTVGSTRHTASSSST